MLIRNPKINQEHTELGAKGLETGLGNGEILLHCASDTNKLRRILRGALGLISSTQKDQTYCWTNNIGHASIRTFQLNHVPICLDCQLAKWKAYIPVIHGQLHAQSCQWPVESKRHSHMELAARRIGRLLRSTFLIIFLFCSTMKLQLGSIYISIGVHINWMYISWSFIQTLCIPLPLGLIILLFLGTSACQPIRSCTWWHINHGHDWSPDLDQQQVNSSRHIQNNQAMH